MPNVQRLMLKLFAKLPPSVLQRMAGGPPIEIRGRQLQPMMQLLWVQGKKQRPISEFEPEQARAVMDEAAALLAGPIANDIEIKNQTIPTSAGELPVRIYMPSSDTPLPVVLFFHQGGFVIGGLETGHSFCALLASEAKCIVLNVAYRLAPEHPFPAPVDDALAAYAWAIGHAAELGGDPSRVGVCGDSAGGMLSALVCQEAKRRDWQMPVCQVLIYPWLVPYSGLDSYKDFGDAYPLTADLMAWFSSLYFTDESQKSDAHASPGDQPDLAGLPAALIVSSGFDPLSDEAEVYADRLREAGVPVMYRCHEDLPHSFCMMGLVPAALAAQRQIAADLTGLLGSQGVL